MKPLLDYANEHPAAAGGVGVASGALAAFLKSLHLVACFVADVGILISFATVILTFLIVRRNYRAGRNQDERVSRRLEQLDDQDRLP